MRSIAKMVLMDILRVLQAEIDEEYLYDTWIEEDSLWVRTQTAAYEVQIWQEVDGYLDARVQAVDYEDRHTYLSTQRFELANPEFPDSLLRLLEELEP